MEEGHRGETARLLYCKEAAAEPKASAEARKGGGKGQETKQRGEGQREGQGRREEGDRRQGGG